MNLSVADIIIKYLLQENIKLIFWRNWLQPCSGVLMTRRVNRSFLQYVHSWVLNLKSFLDFRVQVSKLNSKKEKERKKEIGNRYRFRESEGLDRDYLENYYRVCMNVSSS